MCFFKLWYDITINQKQFNYDGLNNRIQKSIIVRVLYSTIYCQLASHIIKFKNDKQLV